MLFRSAPLYEKPRRKSTVTLEEAKELYPEWYEKRCQQKGVDTMAGTTTNISIRMDSDLKAQADALFAELGMNLSTAFNIFVRQSLREGGIPFEVKLEQPNKETIAAMLEAERIAKDPSVKGYNDLDELFADLKK